MEQISSLKGVVTENLDKLLERDEELGKMLERTETISELTKSISLNSRRIKKRMLWRKIALISTGVACLIVRKFFYF